MSKKMIKLFIFSVLFIETVNAIYLNPYSYGSYDPAAESPEYYNYYARYYNPNPRNPYAPYPTYMKPGVFRLPRQYQIDPAWAPYYPPNRFETLQQANIQGNYHRIRSKAFGGETVAVFPDGCGGGIIDPNIDNSGGGGGKTIEPKSETELLLEDLDRGGPGGYTGQARNPAAGDIQRPQWSANQPTDEQLSGFGQRATLVRPRINHPPSSFSSSSSSGCGEDPCSRNSPTYEGADDRSTDIPNDFERLPLDRINNSPDSDSNGFPSSSSSSSSNFNRKRFNIRRY